MKLTMKDVMTANCQIPHAEMLTSNHCAALARELNAMFEAPVPPAGVICDEVAPITEQAWRSLDSPPAGDVEVLNAMFEFPMPPTVESVLRIAADGSRIRISADGSIYPVPPAGNAEESVADVVMFEGGKIIDGTLAYMETAVVGDRLYSTAHVTRLTAERDEEAFWRKQAREGWGQATKVIEMQRAKLDAQESELTKARELFADLMSSPDAVMVPLHLWKRVQAFAQQSAPAAKCSICNGTGVVGDASIGYDHCFHSAAPAAKGGESGETICLLCFDKKTVPGPKHGDFVRDCPECCGEEG